MSAPVYTVCQRYGCDNPIEPAGNPWQVRKWCSENCRKRAADLRNRGSCIDCGCQLGARSGWPNVHGSPRERCRECHNALERAAHQAKVEDVAEIYRDGMTNREIAIELGYAPTTKPPEITEAHRQGLIVHRRTPEQVERIRAGRWAA